MEASILGSNQTAKASFGGQEEEAMKEESSGGELLKGSCVLEGDKSSNCRKVEDDVLQSWKTALSDLLEKVGGLSAMVVECQKQNITMQERIAALEKKEDAQNEKLGSLEKPKNSPEEAQASFVKQDCKMMGNDKSELELNVGVALDNRKRMKSLSGLPIGNRSVHNQPVAKFKGPFGIVKGRNQTPKQVLPIKPNKSTKEPPRRRSCRLVKEKTDESRIDRGRCIATMKGKRTMCCKMRGVKEEWLQGKEWVEKRGTNVNYEKVWLIGIVGNVSESSKCET